MSGNKAETKWKHVAALFPLYFLLINLLSTTIQIACRELKNQFTKKKNNRCKIPECAAGFQIEQTSNKHRTETEQKPNKALDKQKTAAGQLRDKHWTKT
jgi:hypothetical protein